MTINTNFFFVGIQLQIYTPSAAYLLIDTIPKFLSGICYILLFRKRSNEFIIFHNDDVIGFLKN
jgi:hypothetical protein